MMTTSTGKTSKGSHHAGGFALLELMIALLVLTIGLIAFMGMQMTTIQTNASARHVTQSTMQGTDRVEKLMALPYGDALLQPGTTATVVDGRYTITWQVSAADIPIRNVKTINITTSWEENGKQRSRQYVYYKADKI